MFYIAALVFVIRRRIDRDSAKIYLIQGLSLLLLQSVSGGVVPAIINRFTTPGDLTVLAVYSLCSTLVFLTAIVFLIAAAVTNRHRPEAAQRFVSPANDNPYTPPQT
ncbi:MAG: hypothetical protein GY878_19430 [Fuerstiella sp.]|nr:hypothetical protein [Fuerstiella sp.]